MRTHFLFDFLACIPNIITGEMVTELYFLKVFRILRIFRIINFVNRISSLLKKKFMKHQIFIENFFHLFRTVLILLITVHILACGWIAIGMLENNTNDFENWISRIENIYVNTKTGRVG